jgi:hypothetical protein
MTTQERIDKMLARISSKHWGEYPSGATIGEWARVVSLEIGKPVVVFACPTGPGQSMTLMGYELPEIVKRPWLGGPG